MSWKRFFRRNHWHHERSRELESYLEIETDENIERGMQPEEARYAAFRKLGNEIRIREEIYRMNSIGFLETLWQDTRFGIRLLRKSPGFTAVAVAMLALGIGANTAIFTLINAVMLKNLPVRKPDQLVLFSDVPDEGTITSSGVMHRKWDYFSYAQYRYFCEHNQLFQALGAYDRNVDALTVRVEGSQHGEPMHRALGTLVSGNYFPLLGSTPALGRTLTAQDDEPGAKPAAVISYAYWKRALNGKASALGKVVDLNGTPFTIVGVAPPEFFGVAYVGASPDFWLPLRMQPHVMRRASYLTDHTVYWLNLVGRLKRGVSLKQAEAAVDVQLRQYLMVRWGSKIPRGHLKDMQRDIIRLAPGGKGISEMRLRFSEPLHMLMLVVALVLLIVCANVASMLLARATGRSREISARLAVGATRNRLVRQLLAESAVLAVAGGFLGLLLAGWGVRILVLLVEGRGAVPLNLRPDALVLSFTACVSFLAVMFFGFVPALRASRVDLVSALKASASGSGKSLEGHLALSKGMVVFQVALSLPLLIGAGLFLRSLKRIESREGQVLNPTRKHLLLVRVDPRLAGYQPNQLGSFYQQLLARIEALPGVRSASLAYYSPLSGNSSSSDIGIEGYTPPGGKNMDSWEVLAAPDYFKTESMHLLLGRPFGWQDAAASPSVAVVNEAFAKYFFPNQNPVGRRFSLGTPFHGPGIEIIGVAESVKFNDLRLQVQRMIFLPVLQMKSDLSWLSPYLDDLEIRASGDPRSIAVEVRGAIHEISRSLPVSDVTTLSRQVNESLHQERTVSQLSGFFGLLALVLACTGLYGVMSYNVARRTNEIGIRMALGAERLDVLWMVLRQSLILIVTGVAIGIPVATAATRLISSQLYGVTSTDPLTILFAGLVMLTTGLLAGYLPARRAMRVDPMEALRYE